MMSLKNDWTSLMSEMDRYVPDHQLRMMIGVTDIQMMTKTQKNGILPRVWKGFTDSVRNC